MKCPRCGVLLNELMKAGVQVDVCDQCLGMWLDRGELEKITARIRELERDQTEPRAPERGAPVLPGHAQAPYLPDPRYTSYPPSHHEAHREHEEHHGYQKHQGWRRMLELFD